ncbi:MAG: lipoyl(octanoyl) transferase LipB [Deltaproteobacteria bacterium]|nr:lipoyl(octanoyl) transferase LipB [Deltaproteobacteria bacterium]MBI2342038.1 lipoyl(octanoyl) transferase LipB [Deltaproteobacteria bacterium]
MVQFLDIGIRPFSEVLKLQHELHLARIKGDADDTVIFCQHHPVYTIGKRDSSSDWLSDFKTIASDGIEIIKTDRGGRITYHGPGQLVVYFIFDLNKRRIGIKQFVEKVEEACIGALEAFDISACRNKEHPGLWVNGKKIAALGFHVSNGVTMHGIALNVEPDMSHYKHIIPCGIKDKGVTSMKEILAAAPAFAKVTAAVRNQVSKEFCA